MIINIILVFFNFLFAYNNKMQTVTSNQLYNIINKIPKGLLFNETNDRKQVLQLLNWVQTNVSESRSCDESLLIRTLTAFHLKTIGMKTIEPEVLFIFGLNHPMKCDLECESSILIKKIISENHETFDLDIMQRVLAQIMTRCPRDIKDRITGRQKRELFQKMSPYVNIGDKLLEKFISYDPTMDKDTTVTMELDQGDYANLNKLFLKSLEEKEKKNIYIPAAEIELANQIKLTPTTTSPNVEGNLKASYIDKNPDLMLGVKDQKIYYYDEGSGVITEMPINSSTAQKVTLNQLKTILKTQKVDKSQVDNLIREFDNSDYNTNSTNDMNNLNINNESLFKLLYSKYNNSSDDYYKLINNDMNSYIKNLYELKTSQPSTSKTVGSSSVSTSVPLTTNMTSTIPSTTNMTSTIPSTTNMTSTIPTTTNTTPTIPSTTSVSGFKNIESFTNQNLTQEEEKLIKKAKLYHNDIEITAVGFVTVIVILFLLLIFWSFKQN